MATKVKEPNENQISETFSRVFISIEPDEPTGLFFDSRDAIAFASLLLRMALEGQRYDAGVYVCLCKDTRQGAEDLQDSLVVVTTWVP